MDWPRRTLQLGAAHLATGAWTFVAAIMAAVTWLSLKNSNLSELTTASLPVVGLVVAYLFTTGCVHLRIGRALRQESWPRWLEILSVPLLHGTVLSLVVKVSLRNPSSPVFLAGIEGLLTVLIVALPLSSIVCCATLLLAFFRRREHFSTWRQGSADKRGRAWLTALLGILALAVLASLWRLDQIPLPVGPYSFNERQDAAVMIRPDSRSNAVQRPGPRTSGEPLILF